MAKHIFVTGGVVSSLGKGLTCASIGMLLEHRGLRVRLQKFDPYINVDPGHDEPVPARRGLRPRRRRRDRPRPGPLRAVHQRPARPATATTPPARSTSRSSRRSGSGEYLGKTVQVIPHVTDEIKAAIRKLATDDVDVVITEIGGTVGDIEGLPFLEAIRQFALDVGKRELPVHPPDARARTSRRPASSRPSRRSTPSAQLRQIGIQPDILICRTERAICAEDDATRSPCSATSSRRAVIEERDKEYSIYEVPLSLVEQRARRADRRAARPARPSRSTSATGASCSTGSCTRTTR